MMIDKIRKKLNGDVHLKDLVKGSAITFVLKMGGMALSYILIFLISKKLGAEGVGFFQVMLQILTVLGMVLGLGMNISVLRYVGQFNNEKEQWKMHELYRHFVGIVTPLTILVALGIYFGADFISNLLDKDKVYAEGLKLVAIVLPFFTLNQISVEFIRGLRQLHISEFLRSILRPLVMIMGIYFLFWDQLEKLDLIFLLIAGLVLNSVISSLTIRKKLYKIPSKEKSFARSKLLKTSFPMIFSSITSYMFGFMPIFYLSYYQTDEIVGVYTVAYKLSTLVSLILLVTNTVIAPRISFLYWNDRDALQATLLGSAKLNLFVSIFSIVVLVIFNKQLLAFFGQEYTDYSLLFFVLILGQFINSWTGSVGIILNMCGEQKIYSMFSIIVFFIMLFCFPILITMFGVFGAAISTTLGISFLNFMSMFYIYKKLNLITFYFPNLIIKNG